MSFTEQAFYVVVYVSWDHYRFQDNLCATSNRRKALQIADEEAKKRGLQVYYGESSHDAKDENHIWVEPLTDKSEGTRVEKLMEKTSKRKAAKIKEHAQK